MEDPELAAFVDRVITEIQSCSLDASAPQSAPRPITTFPMFDSLTQLERRFCGAAPFEFPAWVVGQFREQTILCVQPMPTQLGYCVFDMAHVAWSPVVWIPMCGTHVRAIACSRYADVIAFVVDDEVVVYTGGCLAHRVPFVGGRMIAVSDDGTKITCAMGENCFTLGVMQLFPDVAKADVVVHHACSDDVSKIPGEYQCIAAASDGRIAYGESRGYIGVCSRKHVLEGWAGTRPTDAAVLQNFMETGQAFQHPIDEPIRWVNVGEVHGPMMAATRHHVTVYCSPSSGQIFMHDTDETAGGLVGRDFFLTVNHRGELRGYDATGTVRVVVSASTQRKGGTCTTPETCTCDACAYMVTWNSSETRPALVLTHDMRHLFFVDQWGCAQCVSVPS